MADTLQIIVAVIGVGVTILVTVASVAWRLGARVERVESQLGGWLEQAESRIGIRLEHIESRVGDLGAGIRSLNEQVAATVTVIPTVFRFLHRSQAITDTEYHESMEQFINRISQGTDSMVDHLTRNVNPLTPDEARSFRELMAKARRGEFFSREEVDEYAVLIRKIQAEHPDDPRIWPLVTLGVFLQGIYPGSRRPDAP